MNRLQGLSYGLLSTAAAKCSPCKAAIEVFIEVCTKAVDRFIAYRAGSSAWKELLCYLDGFNVSC